MLNYHSHWSEDLIFLRWYCIPNSFIDLMKYLPKPQITLFFASTNKHPKIYAKVLEIQSSQKILKVKKQRWGLTLSSVNVIVKLQKSRQSNTVME
jgi:hypothetical protein